MNKLRVRGIIVDQQEIVLIHRMRGSDNYYVFPGGGVEEGEDLETALKREAREELGIDIKMLRKVYTFIDKDDSRQEFYVCSVAGGKIGTGKGPEFTEYKDRGTYSPLKLPIRTMRNLNVLPGEIKDRFYDDFSRFGDAANIPYSEVRRV